MLTECGYEFTVMAPSNYDVYKDAMALKSKDVRLESCHVPSEDCYGRATGGFECLGAHLRRAPVLRPLEGDRRGVRHTLEGERPLALANGRAGHTEKSGARFEPCVTVTKAPKDPRTGETFRAEPDSAHFQAEIDGAGYFAVVASPGHTSEEVPRAQRLRERAEKSLGGHNGSFGMLAAVAYGTSTYVGKGPRGLPRARRLRGVQVSHQ